MGQKFWKEMAVVCIQAESWQSVPHLAHACSAAQSCLPLFDPRDYRLPCSPSMGFSRQEYWTRLLFLLQGIFLTRELNLGVLHCRQTLYHLSHQGSSIIEIALQFLIKHLVLILLKSQFWMRYGMVEKIKSGKNVGE